MTSTVLAWDDSNNDPSRYLNDKTPKSSTLSGDSYNSRSRSQDESYSKPLRNYDDSRGTRGAYESGNQINNNGLIINRE